MKKESLAIRYSLLLSAVMLGSTILSCVARAQEAPTSSKDTAEAKFPAAKKQAPGTSDATDVSADSEKEKKGIADKDSAEAVRRRDEWFYNQRRFPNATLPSGARLKALEHKQRMMLAEGKLALRPDGSLQAAANPAITLGSNWASLG